MTRISLTFAAAMLAAAPAMAETHSMNTTAMNDGMVANNAINDGMTSGELDRAELIRTRDITGGNIYTMNEAYDEGEWMEMDRWGRSDTAWDTTDWNDIGEIEDIILSRDGQMIGIVAEVGGFLDLGDAHVVISVDDVRLVPVDDQTYAYVTRLSEEQLESRPTVDEGFWD